MKGRKKKHVKNKEHAKTTTSQAPSDLSEIKAELIKNGWGKDILTRTIENAFCNVGVSFLKLKPYFELLIKTDEIFRDVSILLSYSSLDGLIAVSLFGRAKGCFFGAVRLSCSGQITETWTLLRACLENTLYAFYIAENPEYAKVWTDRHDSEDQKRKCKNVFRVGNVMKALEAKSKGIAKEAKDLYDTTIDFGAHPNERSLFMNLEKKISGSGFNLNILNPDATFMRTGLCYILLTTSTVFKIFSLIFPKEFSQANIKVKIQNLHTRMRPLLFGVTQQLKEHK